MRYLKRDHSSQLIASQSIHGGKFKHLKYSENVNFKETNNFVSILVKWTLAKGESKSKASLMLSTFDKGNFDVKVVFIDKTNWSWQNHYSTFFTHATSQVNISERRIRARRRWCYPNAALQPSYLLTYLLDSKLILSLSLKAEKTEKKGNFYLPCIAHGSSRNRLFPSPPPPSSSVV